MRGSRGADKGERSKYDHDVLYEMHKNLKLLTCTHTYRGADGLGGSVESHSLGAGKILAIERT